MCIRDRFEALVAYTEDFRLWKGTMARVCARLTNSNLTFGVHVWNAWCVEQRRIEATAMKIGKRLMNRTLATVFDTWDAFRCTAIDRKAQMASLLYKMLNAQKWSAYKSWFAAATRRVRLQRLVLRMRQSQLWLAFNSWRDNAYTQRQLNEMVSHVQHQNLSLIHISEPTRPY